MPTKAAPQPEPDEAPAATPPAAEIPAASAEPDEVLAGSRPAGTYEFTGTIPTQYLEVPLTARPAEPGQPATKDTPEVPARPATVFEWPFGAPDDGRWQPTRKKPNQVADNEPPVSEE